VQLREVLRDHVAAGFSGCWIQSHEHDECLAEVLALCRDENWRLTTWSIDRGLRSVGNQDSAAMSGGEDPLAAVRALTAMGGEIPSLLLAFNAHRFLGSPEIAQAVAHAIVQGKLQRTFFIIVSPVVQIPVELEKLFVVIEHDLPSRDQLAAIAAEIATEPGELPEGDEHRAILDAAAGLTRYEAEGAFSLSLVQHGRLAAQPIWKLKGQTLKKAGLLSLHHGRDRFADLGGLTALKDFCLRAMQRQDQPGERPQAKGVMLLSPPGCGKSQFVKCLGNETGRPTLTLDVGSLYGSLVGQTEQRVRQAIQQMEAMAPAVVLIDEIEKALGGATAGSGDGGVSTRLFGSLLSWLNDRTSDVFVCCTANDISKLPPEFTRAERFDSIWFIDLPDREQKDSIWSLHLSKFAIDADQPQPMDENWTGAEIHSCCRLAKLLGLSLLEAARYVVPVARTSSESLARLRRWASGRCLSADQGGIYQHCVDDDTSGRPRVLRSDPSQN
jgi:hypothetical protein